MINKKIQEILNDHTNELGNCMLVKFHAQILPIHRQFNINIELKRISLFSFLKFPKIIAFGPKSNIFTPFILLCGTKKCSNVQDFGVRT